MPETFYSSEWGKLSPHLIASFWEIYRDGSRKDPDTTLQAAVIEANLEVTANWQSPFENVGSDVLPTLQQLLQSGEAKHTAGVVDRLLDTNYAQEVKELEGRASITKLNSTQIFNGMPPAKIPVTLLFRAWANPKKEVEQPFDILMKWALPVYLESDSSALSRFVDGNRSFSEAALPSKAPTMIAMKYKNRIYKPLVIESVSTPISSPIDANGDFVELTVQVQLATLAAIDRGDWAEFRVY